MSIMSSSWLSWRIMAVLLVVAVALSSSVAHAQHDSNSATTVVRQTGVSHPLLSLRNHTIGAVTTNSNRLRGVRAQQFELFCDEMTIGPKWLQTEEPGLPLHNTVGEQYCWQAEETMSQWGNVALMSTLQAIEVPQQVQVSAVGVITPPISGTCTYFAQLCKPNAAGPWECFPSTPNPIDVSGRVYHSGLPPVDEFSFPTETLAAGTYYVRLVNTHRECVVWYFFPTFAPTFYYQVNAGVPEGNLNGWTSGASRNFAGAMAVFLRIAEPTK